MGDGSFGIWGVHPDNDPHHFGAVKTRCPRCRSNDLVVSETTEASMLFDVTNGVMKRLTHSEEFGGITGVYVICKRCEHGWTPRRAHQVTDLLKEQP